MEIILQKGRWFRRAIDTNDSHKRLKERWPTQSQMVKGQCKKYD